MHCAETGVYRPWAAVEDVASRVHVVMFPKSGPKKKVWEEDSGCEDEALLDAPRVALDALGCI